MNILHCRHFNCVYTYFPTIDGIEGILSIVFGLLLFGLLIYLISGSKKIRKGVLEAEIEEYINKQIESSDTGKAKVLIADEKLTVYIPEKEKCQNQIQVNQEKSL